MVHVDAEVCVLRVGEVPAAGDAVGPHFLVGLVRHGVGQHPGHLRVDVVAYLHTLDGTRAVGHLCGAGLGIPAAVAPTVGEDRPARPRGHVLEEVHLLLAGPPVGRPADHDGTLGPTQREDAVANALHEGSEDLVTARQAADGHLQPLERARLVHHDDRRLRLRPPACLPVDVRRTILPRPGHHHDHLRRAHGLLEEGQVAVDDAEVRHVFIPLHAIADPRVLAEVVAVVDGQGDQLVAERRREPQLLLDKCPVLIRPEVHSVLPGCRFRRVDQAHVRDPVGGVGTDPVADREADGHLRPPDVHNARVLAGPLGGRDAHCQPDGQHFRLGRRGRLQDIEAGLKARLLRQPGHVAHLRRSVGRLFDRVRDAHAVRRDLSRRPPKDGRRRGHAAERHELGGTVAVAGADEPERVADRGDVGRRPNVGQRVNDKDPRIVSRGDGRRQSRAEAEQ